ncbi:MAG: SUMF1/EgtB/PvdO family nonheme iron enzyme, partial [Candidatus Microthrix subdominans]
MMMSRSVSAPAFWLDSRFNAPMKPVVGVNFYEAEAFCRWQGQVAGRECWLPSLDEWMAGSAGPWSNPWGDEFDPSRANTLEGGLGSTTPVGSYSPDVGGLYDTCGNVWEWTSTTWRCGEVDEPVGMGFDGVEYKVVKGGSWDNRSSYAVLDVFDVDPREMFGTRLGFRVNWGGYA